MVEAQPHRPVLPAQFVAVEGEGRPVRLDDLQRLHVAALDQAGHQVGAVLAHGGAAGRRCVVLDAQQLHGVHVHHEVQAVDRVGVRTAVRGGPPPHVGPAHPPVLELRGDQRVPVGPGVDQDEVEVGDAALGEGRDDVGVLDQHLVRLVPLVQGHVGLLAGHRLPGEEGVVGERDQRLVGGPLVAAPAGHPRLAADRVAGGERADDVLGRLPELHRGEAPALVDAAVAAQDGGGRAELVGGERVERVRGHVVVLGRRAVGEQGQGRVPAGCRRVRRGAGGRSRTAPRGRRGWPAPR